MAKADMINHSIFSADELKQALTKLHMRGLVKSDGNKIMVTELAKKLLDDIMKTKDNYFSITDNTLKMLSRLPVVERTPLDLTFINDSFIHNIYKDYVTWLQNTQAKGRK